MTLSERVHVTRRFQRSIRIDTDLNEPAALEGFICPRSSAEALETMSRHIADTGQAAFTWTGPYGSGKSSLVVALSAALSTNAEVRHSASMILGERTAAIVWNAMPPSAKGWRVIPVVGSRERPAQAVGDAMENARVARTIRNRVWTDKKVLEKLAHLARRNRSEFGGVVVFIDEMGKFLEGAAYDGTDIYFFQQLAELASRSDGRLIVIGVLHQAFEEYAHRLSREIRDEWSKIQGRFIDLAVSVSVDEQIDLLGRAIKSDRDHAKPSPVAEAIAISTRSQVDSVTLERCWPLHPVAACLLSPISRRRFGQNQRSVFGFLNSLEPNGFQDFLRNAEDGDLYTPDMLWDYLKSNLEPSIMASPDGHRWSMASDALDRCYLTGGDELHVRLLKTIALVDLFKERSGIAASPDLLKLSLRNNQGATNVEKAIANLESRKQVIYRKFSNSYGVFEGSDFDIEKAIDEAFEPIDESDFARLAEIADIQAVVAKRHYHDTGTLRWCDVRVVALRDVENAVAASESRGNGSMGTFFLTLPSLGDAPETVERMAQASVDSLREWEVAVGIPKRATWTIMTSARDLAALEDVGDNTPELQGDSVARSEIQARIAELRNHIESELSHALNDTVWYRKNAKPRRLGQFELSSLASEIADARFHKSPRVSNELLNRIKPSPNAVAARNALLRSMVLNEGEERLGIEGYSPEGALFDSLLASTGLYQATANGWEFVEPDLGMGDPCNLLPTWKAAAAHLKDNSHSVVSFAEIYDIWRLPPFGIKDGILSVLAVAFILTRRRETAVYREGVFQPELTDLDVDCLTNDPSDVALRWMELSRASRQLLSQMDAVAQEMNSDSSLGYLDSLDVARKLVSIYDRLPPWVGRTHRISDTAKSVRQLFKRASDPNKFIFDDIPQLLTKDERDIERVADVVRRGLAELSCAYPGMLEEMRTTLLAEFGVSNTSPPALEELRERAKNIIEIVGDHRLKAFVLRISQFQGTDAEVEALASMVINKPLPQWVDSDIDKAIVEIASLTRDFVRLEAFAHVKGRQDRRHAIAVVVGLNGEPIHDEFDLSDSELSQADELINHMRRVLRNSGEAEQNVILAALAKVTAEYLESRAGKETDDHREGTI